LIKIYDYTINLPQGNALTNAYAPEHKKITKGYHLMY